MSDECIRDRTMKYSLNKVGYFDVDDQLEKTQVPTEGANRCHLPNNVEALMASKSQCRNAVKDKNPKLNPKASQNVLADEIALRDEIFELKRQILLLKKANERNLIKVRKYEDEAKKKDRQIEQLMDPVKNGDVRKLLSTKGAALLLNLKEQNNALIQMLLAKDIQIRKLLSEIKTSKLYTSTKRAESYRCEIDRLRNLLIKSQNMVKESQDVQQRRSAVSVQHMSVSSDQSSPRDLEELHFTIQSLEMHMKYSNELLAKKNEQIIQLTDQINSYRCSTCRKSMRPNFFLESNIQLAPDNTQENSVFERDFATSREYTAVSPTFDTSHNSKFVVNHGEHDFDEFKLLPATNAPDTDFRECDDDDAPTSKNHVSIGQDVTHEDGGREYCGGERNLFENKVHKIRNAKSNNCVNETKVEPGKHFVSSNPGISSLHRILEKSSANSLTEEESDVDTEEFEMMEKKIENDQTEIESPVKLTPQVNGYSHNPGLDKLQRDEKLFLVQSDKPESEGGMALVLEQANGELDRTSKIEDTDENLCDGSFELENADGQEKTCEGGHCGTPENSCIVDGGDTGISESVWGSYRYSSDSSFDSQITTGNPVQVEAEINHDGEMEEEHTKSDGDDDEREVIANEIFNETCDNDDDDVVTG